MLLCILAEFRMLQHRATHIIPETVLVCDVQREAVIPREPCAEAESVKIIRASLCRCRIVKLKGFPESYTTFANHYETRSRKSMIL